MWKTCSGFTRSTYADEEVTLNGDVIEKEKKFLGDILSFGGVEEAVTARVRCR